MPKDSLGQISKTAFLYFLYRMQKKKLSLRFHGYGNAVVKANVGRVSDGKLFVNEGEIAGKNIHV